MSTLTNLVLEDPKVQLALMASCVGSGAKLFERKRFGPILSKPAYEQVRKLVSQLENSVSTGAQVTQDALCMMRVILGHFRTSVMEKSYCDDHDDNAWVKMLEQDEAEDRESTANSQVATAKPETASTAKPKKEKKPKATKQKATSSPGASKTKPQAEANSTVAPKKPAPRVAAPPRDFKRLLKHEFGKAKWTEKLLSVYADKIKVSSLAPVTEPSFLSQLTGSKAFPECEIHKPSECKVCSHNMVRAKSEKVTRPDMMHLALAHLCNDGITDFQIGTVMNMLERFRSDRAVVQKKEGPNLGPSNLMDIAA